MTLQDLYDDLVDIWHDISEEDSIAEFLGLTESEYKDYVERPNDFYKFIKDHWSYKTDGA